MADDIRLEMSLEVAKALVNLEQVIVKEKGLDDQVDRTRRKVKELGDAWVSGLKQVSAQQRPIIEGHRRWEQGLSNILSATHRVREEAARTSGSWTAGLKVISAEQRIILQGQAAWAAGIENIGQKFRTFRQAMLDTTLQAQSGINTWLSGLRAISAEQRIIMQGQAAWATGVNNMGSRYLGMRDSMLAGGSGGGSSGSWASGLAAVSASQRVSMAGRSAWTAGLANIGGSARSMRDMMLDTSGAGAGGDSWAAGLAKVSAAQRRIMEGNAAWQAGLANIAGAQKPVEKGHGSILNSVVGMVTAWVGIGTAIRVATAAAEEHKRVLGSAHQATLSLGEAQAAFIRNTAGASQGSIDDAFRSLSTRGTYASPAMLTSAAAKAVAASGDPGTAVAAVLAADPLAIGKPEELEAIASGAQDLAKATGRADMKYNMGLGALIGRFARPEDPAQQARNIGQALSRASAYSEGDRDLIARQGGAIYAAMTQIGVDVTGEEAAGSYSRVQNEMRDFLRDRGMADPQTPLGRMKLFQANPELAREFLDKAEFGHKRFKSFFEDAMLKPGSESTRILGEAVAGITAGDPTQVYGEQVARLGSTGAMRQLGMERRREATEAAADSARTPESLLEEARKIRNEVMPKTRRYSGVLPGFRKVSEDVASGIRYWGVDSEESRIRGMRDELLMRRRDMLMTGESVIGMPTPFSRTRRPDELGPRARQDFEYLERQLKALEDILAELRRIQEQGAVNTVIRSQAMASVEMALIAQ